MRGKRIGVWEADLSAVSYRASYRGECPPSSGSSGDNKKPEIAYLELTSACNSRCPGCLNESFIADFQTRQVKHRFRQRPFSLAQWRKVLDRLPGSVRSVILSGGEPTLHPEFAAIVTEVAGRNLQFVLFSNGRWSAPRQIISLLTELPQFHGFLISLHGSQAATHETFTGVAGSFRQTVQNIMLATQAGLPVSVSTVITRQNLDELSAIVDLALELGAEEVTFNRYLLTPDRVATAASHVQPPTNPQLKEAVAQIEALRHRFSNLIQISYGPCIPQCFSLSASVGCSAGEASFVIDPWGNLKPCLHTDMLAGNLFQESFDALWQSAPLTHWRGLFDGDCQGCAAFAQCGGGCRAMALASGLNHDPLMTIPLSEIVAV